MFLKFHLNVNSLLLAVDLIPHVDHDDLAIAELHRQHLLLVSVEDLHAADHVPHSLVLVHHIGDLVTAVLPVANLSEITVRTKLIEEHVAVLGGRYQTQLKQVYVNQRSYFVRIESLAQDDFIILDTVYDKFGIVSADGY